jgi:aldose 1-epimerase
VLDGRTYHLSPNEPPNHLHGGIRGFDKHVWDAEVTAHGSGIAFRRTSPDGEEGYPGKLDVDVTYTLTGNMLHVSYEATTDAPTHVNLTQHSYFNLCGVESRVSANVLGHCLSINADTYLPVTDQLIPTGVISPVANTPFDFHEPSAVGARNGGNYDHNFILNHDGSALTFAARVLEPGTGRTLEVRTTEPGLQVYSGGDHRGLCLETQHYPDSPNRPEFPPTVLRPGVRYSSRTEFGFGID